MWFRVFGAAEEEPAPAALLEHLQGLHSGTTAVVHCDERGWLAVEIHLTRDASPLRLERYLADEEGIRAELNTWAAWLETCDYSPNHGALMRHVIQTKQLFTVRKPLDAADEVALEKVLEEAGRFLAAATDGVYQIDGRGWFSAAGELLLQEY